MPSANGAPNRARSRTPSRARSPTAGPAERQAEHPSGVRVRARAERFGAWVALDDATLVGAPRELVVGNLADLVFDGQSAITERGLRGHGRRCHYIGNGSFVPGEDEPSLRRYAGGKSDFLALAPWVVSDRSRAALRRVGDELAPGSRRADDYLETALVADLPFPVDRGRRGCAGARWEWRFCDRCHQVRSFPLPWNLKIRSTGPTTCHMQKLLVLTVGGKLAHARQILLPAIHGTKVQQFPTFAEWNRYGFGEVHAANGVAHELTRNRIIRNINIGMGGRRSASHIADDAA